MLSIKNLSVASKDDRGENLILKNISFELESGKTLGIVGESGSGKSMLAKTIMGILDENLKVAQGEIFLDGKNLLNLNKNERKKIFQTKISMIFQDYKSSLDPLLSINDTMEEMFLIKNKNLLKSQIQEKIFELLREVQFKEPEKIIHKYPHMLSGGELQRIFLAISIISSPEILIADEPTTALDVTTQKNILKMLKNLTEKNDTSLILISHDIGIIKNMTEKVLVMYKGRIVEEMDTENLIEESVHPYTKLLLKSLPENAKKGEKIYFMPNFGNKKRNLNCDFFERCEMKDENCKDDLEYRQISKNHRVLCARGL